MRLFLRVIGIVAMLQAPNLEYQVKAAFLYNFAKYVDWPAQAFPASNAPFTICVLGDPFGNALENTVRGETLNGRPVVVRRIMDASGAPGCQILYVSSQEARRAPPLLRSLANAPVLTVGETDDFLSDGGIIRFVQAGRRIRFEIDPDAAQRASLRISSRLLSVAEVVHPQIRRPE